MTKSLSVSAILKNKSSAHIFELGLSMVFSLYRSDTNSRSSDNKKTKTHLSLKKMSCRSPDMDHWYEFGVYWKKTDPAVAMRMRFLFWIIYPRKVGQGHLVSGLSYITGINFVLIGLYNDNGIPILDFEKDFVYPGDIARLWHSDLHL